MHICVCPCKVCANECEYLWKPEECVRSPRLEFQIVVSHLTWVLGIKLQSTAGLASSLNYCTITISSFVKVVCKRYFLVSARVLHTNVDI